MVFVLNRFILQEPVSAPRDMKYKCVIPGVVSYGDSIARSDTVLQYFPTLQPDSSRESSIHSSFHGFIFVELQKPMSPEKAGYPYSVSFTV